MKFDRETLIVMIVCAILLCGWHILFNAKTPELPVQEVPAATTAPAVAEPAASTAAPAEKPAEKPAVSVPETKEIKEAKPAGKSVNTGNEHVVYDFNAFGALNRITVQKSSKTGSDEKLAIDEPAGYEPFSCYVEGCQAEPASILRTSDGKIIVENVLTDNAGDKVLLRKVFKVSEETPAMDCTVSFLPVEGAKAPAVLNTVVVWGGTLPPLKQFSNDDLRDIHRVEYMTAGEKVVESDPSAKPEKFLKKKTAEPVRWISVYNKYFISQLYAETPFNGGCEMSNAQQTLPEIGGVYRNVTVPSTSHFKFYAGAKRISLMKKDMPESCLKGVHLAYWGWLEPLCRPMLQLLNFLKGLTGSYGLAIILLTVLVKLVLWPLIHRGNKSMRRMQKIQPIIKELKEKYKDDQQTFNQKMWEVYRENKVNPVGGCFPMLLQFPVFVALYSTLDSAVELRHVPFLWAADLSRPDLVGPQIFGIGLHPLMLLSTGLMVLQMKMQPQGGDPTQQKMMMLMPIFMLVFFYNFPSGLALYWTVNNILSILQMKYSQYSARKEDERNAQSPDSKTGRRAKTA